MSCEHNNPPLPASCDRSTRAPEIIFLNAIRTLVANVETEEIERAHECKGMPAGDGLRVNAAHLTLSDVRIDCNCREWLMYIKLLT